MALPPMVIDVRVFKPDSSSTRVWLPFFLVWPLLLVIAVFALLMTMLVDFALAVVGVRYHCYTELLLRVLALLPETRGTEARVRSRDGFVDVTIY